MHVKIALPSGTILSTIKPENRFLIQNISGNVIIRAARDNFSSCRKVSFIRYLAAEGYIPDRFESLRSIRSEAGDALRWIIAPQLLEPAISPEKQTNAFMWRLIAEAILLWVGLLVFAFIRAP